MSSPATDLFLQLWRDRSSRAPRTLAKIELTTPSAVTLYVATAETFLSDGTIWEPGLQAEPLRARISRLGTGPDLADCTIRLANRAYGPLGTTLLRDLVTSYKWQGAAVTVYLWNDVRKPDGSQLLAAADLLQVFSGTVDALSSDDSWLTLNLLQRRFWNTPLALALIDKTRYPFAPDGSIGQMPPIVYGDFGAFALRAPHTVASNKTYQEDSGGASGLVPYTIVDPGSGAGTVKLLAAGHKCVKLLDRANGYSAFVGESDVPAPLDTGGLTETLGATTFDESYLSLSNFNLVAYYGIRPSDVRTTGSYGTNTATNPRRAMDVLDETSYATLTQPSNGTLQLMIPRVSEMGNIEAVQVVLMFAGATGNGTANLRIRPRSQATGAFGTAVLAGSTNTVPNIVVGNWDAGYWNKQTWDFGSGTPAQPVDIVVDFDAGTDCTARVYWVALRVKFRPSLSLVTPGRFFYQPLSSPSFDSRVFTLANLTPDDPRIWSSNGNLRPRFDVTGRFFGNMKGFADDGGGTYTGSGGALIERPSDIARHLLAIYAGESLFETGDSTFGSFVRARALLRGAAPNDFKMAVYLDSPTTIGDTLSRLCGQSLSCVYIDRFTGKWMCHPWKPGPAVDYDFTPEIDDFPDLFETGVASDVELVQGVRVQYAFDHYRGRTLFESFVNSSGSSQGYSQAATRDQRLAIDASNNRMDWKVGASTYADTLTTSTYTVAMDLAADVQAILRTRITGTNRSAAGYGFHVVAGYNNALEFNYNGTNYFTTIPAGTYTADQYAAALQVAYRAAAGTSAITVTYDQSVAKLRFQTGGLTLNPALSKFSSASPTTTACWTMGFDFAAGSGGGTNVLSAYPVWADRFWMMAEGPLNVSMLALSGTNVATGCWGALGFDAVDTAAGASHRARLSRGTREAACSACQALFGVRPDVTMNAEWVRDEVTAQLVRDRVFDFGGTPPTWLRARTHAMPDLQRMRVFSCSSSLDARRRFPRYGSDGSWAGKGMRVLEVEQDLGPSYHVEFYAEEA